MKVKNTSVLILLICMLTFCNMVVATNNESNADSNDQDNSLPLSLTAQLQVTMYDRAIKVLEEKYKLSALCQNDINTII